MTATPPATPPLLKTYQEARLLWEAKNWKLAGVADELGEKPELKRFHISHTKLSKKSTSESPSPIEPEVAAAVEALETRPGCERQVEIVTRGLLALHGAAPVPAPVEAGRCARRRGSRARGGCGQGAEGAARVPAR